MAIDERVYYLKVVMILATAFAILGMFSIAVRFVVKVQLELSRIWQHQTPLLSVTPRPLDSFATCVKLSIRKSTSLMCRT